jgi:hypothetical protein
MSAAEYASSKILPRFQNSRTNVNISVTLQDSSLEKLEKLCSFTYLPSTVGGQKKLGHAKFFTFVSSS